MYILEEYHNAMMRLPWQGASARLVIASDNDEGGRELADTLEALALVVNREALEILRDLPAGEGQDWNDVLRSQAGIGPVPPAP